MVRHVDTVPPYYTAGNVSSAKMARKSSALILDVETVLCPAEVVEMEFDTFNDCYVCRPRA